MQIRIVPGLEEPLVATGPTTSAEDQSLDAAITVFRQATAVPADYPETARPFLRFLAAHPDSAWRMAVQTNLGLGYYRAGYFTRAFAAFADAWQSGRAATAPQAKALADRAAGELARMHARVGDASGLEKLFADMGDRRVRGPATELITAANESLWMFRNDPGRSYLCGPMALRNLLLSLRADPQALRVMDEARSGRSGFSLAHVSELARSAGLEHTLVYRAPGTPVPVPSVVNWKVNHYAAIVGEKNGRYHVQDPTFGGGDFWVTRAAIDAEASGYFLVPSLVNPTSVWRLASAEEAQRVYGKGFTPSSSPGPTTCNDKSLKGCCPGGSRGMCEANAHLMLVSVNLSDAPVGYQPQKGPSALIRLTYNQREAFQPATFGFFNIGPKWNLNLLSWVQDDPVAPGQNVLRYEAGGGAIDYRVGYSFNSSSGQFSPALQGGAVLSRVPAVGAAKSYELRMRDGSVWVYGKADGATAGVRRMFLTKMVDSFGNALTLHYDARLRLTSMSDATGRKTRFSYVGADSLLISRITDPFGRFATLRYTAGGYLASITDVIGITSSFTYGTEGTITAMTTPYGTTRFTFGEDTAVNSRFLTITDPLGLTERVEFRHNAPGVSAREEVAPAGMTLINDYLDMRNTFYWDKHAYAVAPTDYTKARITHWLHGFYPDDQTKTSPVVESEKAPLETRVWYSYPGQPFPQYMGSTASPSAIGRLAFISQVEHRTLDSFGTPVSVTDPAGRLSTMTYDASGVDLLAVGKRISGTVQPVATFTYNAHHQPVTYRDAAGQLTQYSYNAAGQPTSATDALGRTTSYAYDGLGRLTTVTNPNGTTQRSFTYDAFDRVATSTDSEGYALGYSYDALDRLTRVAYPDGTTTLYRYLKLDLVATTDRLGRVTGYGYDANRRLTKVTDPLGLVTTYGYYGTGTLKRITDPKGNITRWSVDLQSRPTVKTYADGRKETLAYDPAGRLASTTDALGQTKQYGYTIDDRIESIGYVNARTATPTLRFRYDSSLPQLVEAHALINGFSGRTSFSYHPVGAPGALRLAQEDTETGYGFNPAPVSYQYDAVGRLASRTVDTTAETFEYDALDRVTRQVNPLGAFAFNYLGQTGQVTSESAGNVGTTWAYLDNVNDRRLSEIMSVRGPARGFTYRTTPENRIEGITEKRGAAADRDWTYQYDADDRLGGAHLSTGKTFSYTYDPADNLTSINGKVADYNAVNQLVNLGGQAYIYDANGNLTDDGTRTYRWDAENRLAGIGYKADPSQSTTMHYDGLGRRVHIVDANASTSSENYYTWCGDAVCKAETWGQVVLRRYYAQGEMRPLAGAKYYYDRDHLGSVRSLRDASIVGGPVLNTYDYDPYGNQISASSGVGSSDFRYAGMLYHVPSRIYITKHRAYDPSSGRWLSRDPIRESAGPNIYGYVKGNPISYNDPTGLDAEVCVRAFYPIPTPLVRHCYVRFNYDPQNTMSYDPDGSHSDPAPVWWGSICSATTGKQDDVCIKREMQKCKGEEYHLIKNNCCDCTQRALQACGVSPPAYPWSWPNFPVNR